MDFLKSLVSRLGMFSILYRKLKQVYKCQLLQYTSLILRIFTQRTLCTPIITFHKLALRLFTAIKLKEVSICCLKGQHPLTKIQDLKVYTLSFLQLFLELPETFWGLRKVLYPKKSPKITKHISNPPLWSYFCAISRNPATRSRFYHVHTPFQTFYGRLI